VVVGGGLGSAAMAAEGYAVSDTQFICDSKPFCLCVGQVNLWDECCCTGNVAGCSTEHCESCGAGLVKIDVETGEAA
jgi:hypothetical protein